MSSITPRPTKQTDLTSSSPQILISNPPKDSSFKDRTVEYLKDKQHIGAELTREAAASVATAAKNVHTQVVGSKANQKLSTSYKEAKASIKLPPNFVARTTELFMTHVMRKSPKAQETPTAFAPARNSVHSSYNAVMSELKKRQPTEEVSKNEDITTKTEPSPRISKPQKSLSRSVARAVVDRSLTESEVKEILKQNRKEIERTFTEVENKVESDKPARITHKEFIKCFGKPNSMQEHWQIRGTVKDYNAGKISFQEFVEIGNELSSGSHSKSASEALSGMEKIINDPTVTQFIDQLNKSNRIDKLMKPMTIISDLTFTKTSVKFAADKFAKMGIKDAIAREGESVGHITNVGFLFPRHLIAMEIKKSGEYFEVNISNFGYGSEDLHEEHSVKQYRLPATPEGEKQLQKFISNMYVMKYDMSKSRHEDDELRSYNDNLSLLQPVINLNTTLRIGQNTGSCTVKNPMELMLFTLQREGKIDKANELQKAVFERAKTSLTAQEDPFGLGAIPPNDIKPLRKVDVPNFSILNHEGKVLKHYINVNREELIQRVPIYEHYDQSDMLDRIQSDTTPGVVGRIGIIDYARA